MWLLLLLFFNASFAEEMSSERYCFSSLAQASIAKQKVTMILLPSDVVHEDDQCLVVQMRSHRRELIQRYFLSSFPDAKITFSSDEKRRDPCRLKIEKEKKRTADHLNIGLGAGEGNVTHVDKNATEIDVIEIETLHDFEFSVDQNEVKGTCRFINANKYEVSLEVRKNPRPLIDATLPPGSMIIVNQLPPDQETSVLKTVLELSRGERINVGTLVRGQKEKHQSASLNPEIIIHANNQQSSEMVFLSLK